MKAASRLCSAPLLIASAIRVGLPLICWVLTLSPIQLCAQTNPGDQDNKLEPVHTSITIVENISTEAPANVLVIGQKQLQVIPGVNLDDRLRDVPGFSLFRRSSGLAAHPTTQGVSLRGIGSSGASRTLLLWEGVPVNDPFGGWVYWTRFPPGEIARRPWLFT